MCEDDYEVYGDEGISRAFLDRVVGRLSLFITLEPVRLCVQRVLPESLRRALATLLTATAHTLTSKPLPSR